LIRRSEYLEKLQADFDSRVEKQGSKKHAKNTLSRLVSDFTGYMAGAVAPSYSPAVALA